MARVCGVAAAAGASEVGRTTREKARGGQGRRALPKARNDRVVIVKIPIIPQPHRRQSPATSRSIDRIARVVVGRERDHDRIGSSRFNRIESNHTHARFVRPRSGMYDDDDGEEGESGEVVAVGDDVDGAPPSPFPSLAASRPVEPLPSWPSRAVARRPASIASSVSCGGGPVRISMRVPDSVSLRLRRSARPARREPDSRSLWGMIAMS